MSLYTRLLVTLKYLVSNQGCLGEGGSGRLVPFFLKNALMVLEGQLFKS